MHPDHHASLGGYPVVQAGYSLYSQVGCEGAGSSIAIDTKWDLGEEPLKLIKDSS